MNCPYCDSEDLSVVDKRDISEALIRRRRECNKCKQRFTTFEKIGDVDFFVIKKDGTRQKFDKDKIKNGIVSATKNRPVTMEQIEKIIFNVLDSIKKEGEMEITTEKIGSKILKQLKKIDEVAYIRFASIYKDFQNVEDFKKEISKLE